MNIFFVFTMATLLIFSSVHSGENVKKESKPASSLKLKKTEVFYKSPKSGTRINAYSFYNSNKGNDLISIITEQVKSDSCESAKVLFSKDHGKTWSLNREEIMFKKLKKGTMRRFIWPGWVDPENNILLTFSMVAITPTDSPYERVISWRIHYSLSKDGGKTEYFKSPVIQKGKEFNEDHPFPNVNIGKNAAMIGDTTMLPIRLKTGEVLMPVAVSLVDSNGKVYLPFKPKTYHTSAVLIGKWKKDLSGLDWKLSNLAQEKNGKSTRGMIEPTITECDDGKILMVMRGSNASKRHMPSYRWYSLSEDKGQTWSEPKPWAYTDGKKFFSPSSCSQLLKHSNGKTYWIGNISAKNPDGNLPRYPIVIGEVDQKSKLLIKSTLVNIDHRKKGDPEKLTLSNFNAREERGSGDILVYCTPIWRGHKSEVIKKNGGKASKNDMKWTGDAMVYRIQVKPE